MPGGGFLEHTLVHLLRAQGASPMHRLDRWTSGAVLCTTDRSAAAHIAAQFRENRMYKRYRALASGRIAWDELHITQPIGPVPHPILGTVHAASDAGKHASSTATVVQRREQVTLCDITIATGRPHQIRTHMAWAGHALVGDPLYGAGGLPIGKALPGDPGYALHSAEIRFETTTGDTVRVTAPPPKPLR
jgi:23S rRNA pseudouridine1911/1915/1917 synthase